MAGKNRANRQRRKEARRILTPGDVNKEVVKSVGLEVIEAELQGEPIGLFKEAHVQLPPCAEEAVPMQVAALTQLANVLGHEALEMADRVEALEGVAVNDLAEIKVQIEKLTARLEKALEESRNSW